MEFTVTYADPATGTPTRTATVHAADIDVATDRVVRDCPGPEYVVRVEQADTFTDAPAPVSQDEFVGLAFPVIRVRYAGPTGNSGSRYIATLRGVRHTEHYDYALSGPANAYNAAAACWAKYRGLQAVAYPDDEQPRVFVPGDLDADSYSFTVVPAGFFPQTAPAPQPEREPEPGTGVNLAAVERLEHFAATERLEYLRGELRAERISYGELAELQDLAPHIGADDLELREAAGLPERED